MANLTLRRPLFAASLCLLASASMVATAQTPPSHGALELTSSLGRKLYALPDDDSILKAREALAADPKSTALALKLSLAQASRRQYNEAVATDTAALAFAPSSAELYLERGHRELGLRKFAAAQTDLEHAAQLDPKMLDAFYHLGLAHYFQGRFTQAADAFTKACHLAKTDDSLIDCTAWLYASDRRAGNETAAAAAIARITPAVKNTEDHLFFYLQLERFYQGKLTAKAVLPPPPNPPGDLESELSFNTVSYGVGNWNLYNHNPSGAQALFRKVVTGEAWNSWGFIGSETDLRNAR